MEYTNFRQEHMFFVYRHHLLQCSPLDYSAATGETFCSLIILFCNILIPKDFDYFRRATTVNTFNNYPPFRDKY